MPSLYQLNYSAIWEQQRQDSNLRHKGIHVVVSLGICLPYWKRVGDEINKTFNVYQTRQDSNLLIQM